jgi:hypothetical protein
MAPNKAYITAEDRISKPLRGVGKIIEASPEAMQEFRGLFCRKDEFQPQKLIHHYSEKDINATRPTTKVILEPSEKLKEFCRKHGVVQ